MKDQIRTATDAIHNSAIEALSQRSPKDTNQAGPPDPKPAKLSRQALVLGFSPDKLFDRWWSLTDSGDFETRDAEFKTPKAVASLTRCNTESWIRGLCAEGKMPSIKIFNRIYIHLPSLRDTWRKLQQ